MPPCAASAISARTPSPRETNPTPTTANPGHYYKRPDRDLRVAAPPSAVPRSTAPGHANDGPDFRGVVAPGSKWDKKVLNTE